MLYKAEARRKKAIIDRYKRRRNVRNGLYLLYAGAVLVGKARRAQWNVRYKHEMETRLQRMETAAANRIQQFSRFHRLRRCVHSLFCNAALIVSCRMARDRIRQMVKARAAEQAEKAAKQFSPVKNIVKVFGAIGLKYFPLKPGDL